MLELDPRVALTVLLLVLLVFTSRLTTDASSPEWKKGRTGELSGGGPLATLRSSIGLTESALEAPLLLSRLSQQSQSTGLFPPPFDCRKKSEVVASPKKRAAHGVC